MTDEITQSNGEKESNILKIILEPNYSLLKKFRDLAPGTFKHSQNVSSMVEAISIALGLDVVEMKVLSQYHDIGKILNAKYFTENQFENENPHNNLEPLISYQIISRHISDTAMILINDGNFPIDLIRIALQHHGTSVIQYFFDKSGSDLDDLYRYKSEKPKCVESAILMICDRIEARTRADIQSGDFSPDEIIEETINYLMSDGQLDDVVMRLGDLQTIKDVLRKELEGSFQKRVDYKKAKEETN